MGPGSPVEGHPKSVGSGLSAETNQELIRCGGRGGTSIPLPTRLTGPVLVDTRDLSSHLDRGGRCTQLYPLHRSLTNNETRDSYFPCDFPGKYNVLTSWVGSPTWSRLFRSSGKGRTSNTSTLWRSERSWSLTDRFPGEKLSPDRRKPSPIELRKRLRQKFPLVPWEDLNLSQGVFFFLCPPPERKGSTEHPLRREDRRGSYRCSCTT